MRARTLLMCSCTINVELVVQREFEGSRAQHKFAEGPCSTHVQSAYGQDGGAAGHTANSVIRVDTPPPRIRQRRISLS
ncbi:hypothetical protein BDN72DRAFT_843247 [Pluteus cervinus]|uniref:Uncharacterized protein n=1 Tax=Pluteus cervinus TaxID=181527 RepID=A0ACD3ANS7_9AGAR|nr:hypothetical protein BDN72DRAFT_843247 [Pluteus cervinus]